MSDKQLVAFTLLFYHYRLLGACPKLPRGCLEATRAPRAVLMRPAIYRLRSPRSSLLRGVRHEPDLNNNEVNKFKRASTMLVVQKRKLGTEHNTRRKRMGPRLRPPGLTGHVGSGKLSMSFAPRGPTKYAHFYVPPDRQVSETTSTASLTSKNQ